MSHFYTMILRSIPKDRLKCIIKNNITNNEIIQEFIFELIHLDNINNSWYNKYELTFFNPNAQYYCRHFHSCGRTGNYLITTDVRGILYIYCKPCITNLMNDADNIININGKEIFDNIKNKYLSFKNLRVMNDDIFNLIINDLIQLYLK